ncbi:MAG: hypothetical protein HGA51_06800 [Demequinaceae bacterium]|nr:hypothetical protein [Demequinaceae bacterium]
MAKKKNSRKLLAVALGIMGIAGLSLASASQLNITATPDNFSTGTQVFGSACDDTVAVAYTTGVDANGVPTYTGYTVSGIAATCQGKDLTATVKYSPYSAGAYQTPVSLGTTPAATAITAANSDTNAMTVVFAAPLAGTSRLDSIAITIK